MCIRDRTNTGKTAGKEVIQLYYGAPQGKLGKPAKVLGAFKKTSLLQPGERQILTLKLPVNQMVSYDDLGKVCKSAYVLEAGEYLSLIHIWNVFFVWISRISGDNTNYKEWKRYCANIARIKGA